MCIWLLWNIAPCSFDRENTQQCIEVKAKSIEREQMAIDGILKAQKYQTEWDKEQIKKHQQNIEALKR